MDTEDTRTRADCLRVALEKLRDAFPDGISVEQGDRFDLVRDCIAALAEEQRPAPAAVEDEPALVPAEPEPQAEYSATSPAVTIHLTVPFVFGEQTVAAIELRPPAFNDVQAVTDGEISERELHARMARVPAAALRALSWPDYEMLTVAARHLAPEMRRA